MSIPGLQVRGQRPALESIPEGTSVAVWREYEEITLRIGDAPAGDMAYRGIERSHRIISWVCPCCQHGGRMWAGEPPTANRDPSSTACRPELRQLVAGGPGCPNCGAAWRGRIE